ncbi:uncharacterized protein LOC142341581 isoform X2 [Convolutriloba macropyga]|uniref:uncharacterized protein LOC142341581 isoform X2 n=1 Tax=Convolutriloba macropyga TaxID=536237 RepID=UPI003F51FF65
MSCVFSKFIVYLSILLFLLLLALKLDGLLAISFWSVFTPLFVWKTLVVVGAFVGSIVWCASPQLRFGENRVEFQSMLLCVVLCFQLALFEVLCCLKLNAIDHTYSNDTHYGHMSWFIVFAPLIFSTPYSCFYFWWLYRHDRSFILELLHASNLLFYLFVTIKLDGVINWSWALVFVPVWLLVCVLCFVVIYCTFWSVLMLRQMSSAAAHANSGNSSRRQHRQHQQVSSVQRRYYIRIISTGLVLLCPLIAFLVLLVHKLETVWDSAANVSSQSVDNRIDANNGQLSADALVGSSDGSGYGSLDNGFIGNGLTGIGGEESVRSMYSSVPWVVTLAPSYITLLALVVSTVGTKGGNRWFFGLKTDLFSLAMSICPCLKEYANISFKQSPDFNLPDGGEARDQVNPNEDGDRSNSQRGVEHQRESSSWSARSQMWLNLRMATSIARDPESASPGGRGSVNSAAEERRGEEHRGVTSRGIRERYGSSDVQLVVGSSNSAAGTALEAVQWRDVAESCADTSQTFDTSDELSVKVADIDTGESTVDDVDRKVSCVPYRDQLTVATIPSSPSTEGGEQPCCSSSSVASSSHSFCVSSSMAITTANNTISATPHSHYSCPSSSADGSCSDPQTDNSIQVVKGHQGPNGAAPSSSSTNTSNVPMSIRLKFLSLQSQLNKWNRISLGASNRQSSSIADSGRRASQRTDCNNYSKGDDHCLMMSMPASQDFKKQTEISSFCERNSFYGNGQLVLIGVPD